LMSLSMTANKAHAGGYDDPNLLTDEERVSNMKTTPTVLSWDKWEKPYVSGDALCRRKNGDVICLPTIMAIKVRAHIYSPPKSNASQTAKPK
jgi:hypothetical protein